MGKTVEFPGFCGPSYREDSAVLDAERSVNLFPVPGGSNSKSKVALYGRPGLSLHPFIELPIGPARYLWAGDNRLFAIGGTNLYELDPGGFILTDFGAMPGASGFGPATAVANGRQLLVLDASAGQIYNADPGIGAVDGILPYPTMTPVFRGVALDYLDGFYVAIAFGESLAGSNPNQVNVSALGDGSVWDPLAYVIKEGSSDLITQLATLNGQLWIFGQKTCEVWYNAGNPTFPFQRIQGATLNLGLVAPWSVVKFENSIIWLASDDRGYTRVYQAKGLEPQRVSTYPIELILGNPATVGLLPSCQAYGYQENGHSFYVLQMMGTNDYRNDAYRPILCVVYDLTTGMWHERIYTGATTVTGGVGGPWPVCFASVPGFNSAGPNFVGDAYSGKIFFQSTTYPSDAGQAINYTRTSPHSADRNRWIKYPSFELDCDMGNAAATLSYSNDGGRNFLNLNRSDATKTVQPNFGTRGAMGRLKWHELGRSRDRVFSISISDSQNLIRILNAYLGVGQGEEA
jgi:hypothetical protein